MTRVLSSLWIYEKNTVTAYTLALRHLLIQGKVVVGNLLPGAQFRALNFLLNSSWCQSNDWHGTETLFETKQRCLTRGSVNTDNLWLTKSSVSVLKVFVSIIWRLLLKICVFWEEKPCRLVIIITEAMYSWLSRVRVGRRLHGKLKNMDNPKHTLLSQEQKLLYK